MRSYNVDVHARTLLHICIRLHILSATANRNAVIMDALPATVVQQCEGFGGGLSGQRGCEGDGKAGGREAAQRKRRGLIGKGSPSPPPLLPFRATSLSSAKLRNLRVNISVGFYTGPRIHFALRPYNSIKRGRTSGH